MGKIKPLSPEEISIELPDFVIEGINSMIKKKYRGEQFSIKAKEIIAEGRKLTTSKKAMKDWYYEKWMDFEKIYREEGWGVKYEQSGYGDSDFDAYYTFTPTK